jgi:hypothetical protein
MGDGRINDFTRCVPKLEELRLSGFEFTNTFSHLSRIINFHQLVRLELLGSIGGMHHFLRNLAWGVKQLAVYFEESAILQTEGNTSNYSKLLVSANDYSFIQQFRV